MDGRAVIEYVMGISSGPFELALRMDSGRQRRLLLTLRELSMSESLTLHFTCSHGGGYFFDVSATPLLTLHSHSRSTRWLTLNPEP